MKRLVFAACAGAALSIMSVGSAFSATVSCTLTNNCSVIDQGLDFVLDGQADNPLVTLGVGNTLGITEFFFPQLGQTGPFSTTGTFSVDGVIADPVKTKVTLSIGDVGVFNSLGLAFNGNPLESILGPLTTFFFSLLPGANSFTIAGNANPDFVGPIGYNIKLEASAVPLPPALLLFGSALTGLGFLARRKRMAGTSV